jgi:hypothetical protein
MKFFALVAARHRGWQPGVAGVEQRGSEGDRVRCRQLLEQWARSYPNSLCVLGLGADSGLNRSIRESCIELTVPYVEMRVTFSRVVPQILYEYCLLSRHHAIVSLAHELHILLGRSRLGHTEDLIFLAKASGRPFRVYGEDWEVVEESGSA